MAKTIKELEKKHDRDIEKIGLSSEAKNWIEQKVVKEKQERCVHHHITAEIHPFPFNNLNNGWSCKCTHCGKTWVESRWTTMRAITFILSGCVLGILLVTLIIKYLL